jgi:hypothetical protein
MSARVTAQVSLLVLAISGSFAAAQKDKDKSEGIVPTLNRCELAIGDRTLKPARISEDSMTWRRVGDRRVAIDKEGIRAFGKDHLKSEWTADSLKGIELAWLRDEKGIGYVAGLKPAGKNRDEIPETPLVVRRIDLTTGKWLDPLPIEPDGKVMDAKSIEEIGDVLPRGSTVVILTHVKRETGELHVPFQNVAYRVVGFKDGKHAWSATFKASGELPRLGVALWASRRPETANPDIAPLTLLRSDNKDRVLACAGPLEPVRCFDIQTGKEIWSLPRLWEYRRGFTGPSVWQHHLGRHGRDWVEEKDVKDDEKAKNDKNGDQNEVNYLVGGPIVVPQEKGEPRIFLATGTAPPRYSTYLTECTVYEVNSSGSPVARAALPRLVQGGRFQVVDGGVVWSCGGGALVKLNNTGREAGLHFGPGGHDCLCDIDWYRQLRVKTPTAWLTSDPSDDPLAFTSEQAFRVRIGGYVKEAKERIFRFPIAVVDLQTGQESSLLLTVPFEGDLPEPVTNVSRHTREDGTNTFATFGPYHLGITSLSARPGQLDVTLGMENWHRTLTFDFPERGDK